MREVCDEPADRAVGELFEKHDLEAVGRLMRTLVRNDALPPQELPEYVKRYLEDTDDLPPWADLARIRRGSEFFADNGPAIVMAFNCASLPFCYVARKGVQVLHLTARLQTNPVRRIAETSQMIVDVLAPGGLEPGGAGIRDAQKVRLMHAAVRHLIDASGSWDPEWGRPINQEDLAGTLISFTVPVIRSLRKLGVNVGEEQADDYQHAWNVVGSMLGIDERLLCRTYAEAEELSEAILHRHLEACVEGREMTEALVQSLEHLIPGTMFDGLPGYMIRYLGTDELADALGVAPADAQTERLAGPLRRLLGELDDVADGSRLGAWALTVFSQNLIEGMTWVARGGQRAPFTIPETLATRWAVRPPPAGF
jgi:hypothetical protein